MPADVVPSPNTWVVRLKNHKTTILIHADPKGSIKDIKMALLEALKVSQIDGQLNGHPLPDSYLDIDLARPKDLFDLSKGWIALDSPTLTDEGLESGRGSKADGMVLDKALTGVGVKEHAVMAFKFAVAKDEDDDDEDEEKQWDVVIPSFDDEAPRNSETE